MIADSLAVTDEVTFTIKRLSEVTGLGEKYWRQQITNGVLAAVQERAGVGGSRLLVPRAALYEFLLERVV
jgi:hypothetical protein